MGECQGVAFHSELKQAKIPSYTKALEKALEYILQRFKAVEDVKIERIYMEPHWEDGFWVVNLSFSKKKNILSKQTVRTSLRINPISGEIAESKVETV